ncbi:MAG: NAD(P)H-dependent oxidoreductase subunit E [Gammaproteobacteria bacterium]|nr:NAD(P)H-dependent oxidoreductase subunit E [Gammaproteobacteria bacterium]
MGENSSIEQTVTAFSETHSTSQDQLLPLLHTVQQEHGYIPQEAVGAIADALNLSRADVFGVLSFYDDFLREPPNQIVEICGAEACQALGCRSLLDELVANLGAAVTVKEVFCLGNCAAGPSARIGATVLGRATSARIRAVLDSEPHR